MGMKRLFSPNSLPPGGKHYSQKTQERHQYRYRQQVDPLPYAEVEVCFLGCFRPINVALDCRWLHASTGGGLYPGGVKQRGVLFAVTSRVA